MAQHVDGVLSADAVYTVEGLRRAAGIGRETLAEARQSGLVKSVLIGKRRFYFGSEIVEWMRRMRDTQSGK